MANHKIYINDLFTNNNYIVAIVNNEPNIDIKHEDNKILIYIDTEIYDLLNTEKIDILKKITHVMLSTNKTYKWLNLHNNNILQNKDIYLTMNTEKETKIITISNFDNDNYSFINRLISSFKFYRLVVLNKNNEIIHKQYISEYKLFKIIKILYYIEQNNINL